MSLKKILEDDWSDYDNLKVIDVRDRNLFSCTEVWEVDYLRNKIKKHHSELSTQNINKAIQLCCSIYRGQNKREEFIEAVFKLLGV